MGLAYQISVFLHVVFAMFWIGGMLFMPLVLIPAIKGNKNRVSLLYKTGVKFRFFGWVALVGMICTGFFNMYAKGLPFSFEFLIKNEYGQLLGIKIFAFVIMIIIGAIHDFYVGNKAIEQMQQVNMGKMKHVARWSGRINLLLALIIAFLGVAVSRGGF